MASRFTTIGERDLGAGIDQQSAENRLKPGYSEDILNMDPKATGSIKTRVGYQGYLGNLPVRVKSVEYASTATNNLCFFLDGSIDLTTVDLSKVKSTPIMVFGKTSSTNSANVGDFPNNTDSVNYYPGFTVELKKIFLTGSNTLSIPAGEHPFTNPFLFVGVSKSTSVTNNNNEVIFGDTVRINQSSYDINIDYTNGGSQFDGFTYILDKSADPGTSYVSACTSIISGAPVATSFTAATHGLSNFNIIAKVYEDFGGELIEVIPDSVEVDTLGETTITLTNSSGVTKDYYFVLTAAPINNVVTGSVSSGASTSIVIEETEKDFVFAVPYLEQTIGGTLEQVYPDSIISDSDASTITISFTNNTPNSANFQIYYIYANVATNKLCVDASVIGGGDIFSDADAQISIYGLPHSEIYGGSLSDAQGVVNQIDSYRAAGEDRLITGLGGNLFSAKRVGDSVLTAYEMTPTYYPNMRGRIASETILGPVFYDDSDTPGRTRGSIQASNGGSNWLEIDSATYQSDTGYTRLVLLAPDLTVNGTLSTIISTETGKEDYLTVRSMGHSRFNGRFQIKTVTTGADTVIIDIDNPSITDSCYDEVDAGGLGGIFSEQVTLLAASPFIPGDSLTSELISDITCITSKGMVVSFEDITTETTVPAGLRLVGTRNTSLMSIRELDLDRSTNNVVRGDMLVRPDLIRNLQVLYVNPNGDETVSITGDGISATVTLSTLDTRGFAVGQTVLLLGTDSYIGNQVITEIVDDSTFKFASTVTTTESATLVGYTVEVDEKLDISDTLGSTESYTVEGRWFPIEAPSTIYNIPATTHRNYFNSDSYTSQTTLRSTMVQDNMYFTNGKDEVMKYDGNSLYRAGLFRWQPHLYAAIDTTSTGKIDTGNFSVAYSSVSDNVFTLTTAADAVKYSVGQQIRDLRTDSLYTITKIEETAGTFTVNKLIDAVGPGALELSTITQYSYYFRLNAVDRNNNIIGSAVVGSEDFVVTLAEDASVNIRLVGMPVWDIYDYDRLEVQIYRTKANDFVNFFLLTTLPMSFNEGEGYLDYIDTDSDIDLINDDAFAVAIAGAELPTAISEPLRAKYITSSDNRLVLSNITDYPSFDIQFIQNQTGPINLSSFTSAGNERYLFRKSNTDTGTTTNLLDRVGYEFTSTSSAITSIANNAGASFTVTAANSLSAGDWVYLFHTAIAEDKSLKYAGLFMVESATGSDFTVAYTHSASYVPGAADVDGFSTATAPADVPVFLGTDGNYNTLNGNRGSTESYEFIAVRRLANMINSSMRQVNTTLFPDFDPFLIANAGGEFGFGQLVVKCPKVLSTNLELVIPSLDGSFDIFVNSVLRGADEQAGTLTRNFPSRTLISYPNFPEVFDSPTVTVDSNSASAIDINSADGQELTAVIPFFGDSAFGQANKSGIIVNFKENSIYLSDISAKDSLSRGQVSNTPVIQKLETEGKGCTAPYSVAVTRAGVMFANFSGIYRLTRNLNIEYIGRKIERIWREQVNRENIGLITGHHYSNGNQYKLSVPLGDSQIRNNYVLVYSHTREYEGGQTGSWTTYDNHPVTGWANLLDDAYLATGDGRVMSIRRANDNTDYRDGNQSISWRLLTRAMDFGDSGIRKGFSSIITHYRTIVETASVLLKTAVDLKSKFLSTDGFTIRKPTANTGLSDTVDKKVVSIKSSLDENTGNYLQLEYTGNQIDSPVEISGIDTRVTGRNSKGFTEASDT